MAKRGYNRSDPDSDYEVLKQKFGQRIHELRVKANLSQSDLARLAHLHRTHVGKLETASVDPTLFTLFKIAKVFDMSLSELFETITEKG